MSTEPHYREDDTEMAVRLYEEATGQKWENAEKTTRRSYIIEACMINNERDRLEREAAAGQAKQIAVDAYRASIVGTVPAHRLDTRQNGFLDGWDAALAWAAQQRRNAVEGK